MNQLRQLLFPKHYKSEQVTSLTGSLDLAVNSKARSADRSRGRGTGFFTVAEGFSSRPINRRPETVGHNPGIVPKLKENPVIRNIQNFKVNIIQSQHQNGLILISVRLKSLKNWRET